MATAAVSDYPVSSPEELDVFLQRNKENDFQDLSPQGRAFAHSYVETYSHREAAVLVGKSAKAGIKMLRDPLIATYIVHLQEGSRLSAVITKDFINAHYLRLLNYAMGEEAMPIVTGNGEQIYAKKVMVGEAKNILSEMAKSTEYEKDTGSKTAAVSISINLGSVLGSNGDSNAPITVDGEIIE